MRTLQKHQDKSIKKVGNAFRIRKVQERKDEKHITEKSNAKTSQPHSHCQRPKN